MIETVGDPAYTQWPISSVMDRSNPKESLRSWQAGRCAICGYANDPLQEDHDHSTGIVRGLLCQSCNTREGISKGLTTGPIHTYRTRPPTQILGIPYKHQYALKGVVSLSIRFPASLYGQLREHAFTNNTSMNATIVKLAASALRKDDDA